MNDKVYMVYAFENDNFSSDEHLLAVCSSEEKAKRYILNTMKQDILKYEPTTWEYSLSNLPSESDFSLADNSIVLSKFDDVEGYHSESGYYYSEHEVI